MYPGTFRNLACKRVLLLLQELQKWYTQVAAVNTWTTSSEVKESFIFVSQYIYEGRIILKRTRCYFIKLLEPEFYIEILAHPVGKMRIIQEPNKVAL